jgi:hypothetical protein
VAEKRPARARNPHPASPARKIDGKFLPAKTLQRLVGFITLSAIICLLILANLHSFWTPLPWLFGITIWAYYFWWDRVEAFPLTSTSFSFPRLLLVLGAASVIRLFRITELPLGPYPDEIFTLNNSLGLLHRPFDLFGHTPLIMEGWVETANLYLYFNLLIEKLFGVSYWSMKLFSVIPGVIACGAVFLIGQLLFSRRIALLTTLLFTFAHWPVRLSRYGWDASFMIMAFSLAIWLLLFAMQRGRPLYAYAAGLTAGLCLYSYLASRVCLLSLLFFLAVECAMTRGRAIFKQGGAFATGAAMAAYPLLCYYLFEPRAFWVRTAELDVFNSQNPLPAILDNIWRHALMFFVIGGAYARDNFPGLPMMDPLTGLLFIVGLVILFKAVNTFSARLIACTLVLNFATGVFSVSQEGPPYVYRTAAVMIPAFLIAGIGAQFLIDKAESKFAERQISKYFGAVTWPVLMLIIVLNLYFYFGLEPHNAAAIRVMAYEPRLIGLEIARDHLPVILVGRDILDPSNVDPRPGEKYVDANPPLILPPAARKLAVINFSGRYDPSQTVLSNFTNPKDIYFVERAMMETNNLTTRGPTKVIFRSSDRQLAELIQRDYPDAAIKQIRNIYQEPFLSVATLHRENTPESPPVTDASTVK